MLSMFNEKGDPAGRKSMTRVVAFMFAVTVDAVLLIQARKGIEVNGPLAFVATVTLLAVPLQALLRGTKGADVAIALFNTFRGAFARDAQPSHSYGFPMHGVRPSPDYAPPPGFRTDADYAEEDEA